MLSPKLTPTLNSAKFQPKPETLPPLSQLLSQARFTQDDVLHYLELWKENPPDEEYTNLLECEVVDE